MTPNIREFLQRSSDIVQTFNAWAQAASSMARADHVCWRCASSEEYDRIRQMFEAGSRFIYQSEIAGRRISVIGLRESIATDLGEIRTLELSDQKPDGSQRSGFDHIEVYPIHGSVDTLAQELTAAGVTFQKTVRPHHTTYDAALDGGFNVRLESEPLVEKIKRDEFCL
jgi:predicted metalloenzyme YecM